MSRAITWVIALVLFTLFSSFIKTLLGTVGLPNVMPALRDPLLIGLSIYGIGRLDFFASRIWPLLLACIFGFMVPYIFIAMIEDRAFVGLYYMRLYLLPFIFFIGTLGILKCAEPHDLQRGLLRFFIYWNNILFAVAVVIYTLLQSTPSVRATLFGPDLLPSAWYISGGTWMRMGLPLSGPNTLGLIFALNSFLFLSVVLTQKELPQRLQISSRTLVLSAFLAISGLLLSFSRSSMLLLIVATPLIMMTPGVMSFTKMLKVTFIGLVMLCLMLVLALVVDEFSNGYVTRWVVLNTSLSDPSMMGHWRSITDAIDKFHEYMAWGYPKGTVGPKSVIFTGITNNVENSFLAVIYDMGLFFAAIYGLAVATLLATGYRNRLQLILLMSFFPPCFLLPYVFEADVLIYFAFVYLVLGTLVSDKKKPDQSVQRRGYSLHPA